MYILVMRINHNFDPYHWDQISIAVFLYNLIP